MQDHYNKNDNDYMLLQGDNDENLIIFVHGFGSSPLDLMPLAKKINENGTACAMLLLSGHAESASSLIGKDYNTWLNEVITAIEYYNRKYSNVFLIGFSLGATLCIDASQTAIVKGIVGISTFIELKSPLHKYSMALLKILQINRFPRFAQATDSNTKKELDNLSFLPRIETEKMLKGTKNFTEKYRSNETRILLFHSIDDKVADYEKVRKLRVYNDNIKLITLRGLNHLLQFDIPTSRSSQLISEFFFNQDEITQINDDAIRNDLTNISSEFNLWAGLLFKLIVGFFTIFGSLVYFSLPDILQNKASTPYYLISYSILNSLFIVLASMYFFFVNRANAYMKHILEPYLSPMAWVTYRTNSSISGKESLSMTSKASIAIIGTPLTISVASLAYLIYQHIYKNYNDLNPSLFILIAFFCALALLAFSISSIITLNKYTKRELYQIHTESFNQKSLNKYVVNLYKSVEPGCVKQLT